MIQSINRNESYAQYYASKKRELSNQQRADLAHKTNEVSLDTNKLLSADVSTDEKILSPYEYMKETECETCKNRKYQDGSNDSGVSFQNPTHLDVSEAASAVKGHEAEHVFRNNVKAQMENRHVIQSSVAIHTAVCPECGKVYVSGGTTTTKTAANVQQKYNVGLEEESKMSVKV